MAGHPPGDITREALDWLLAKLLRGPQPPAACAWTAEGKTGAR